MTAAWLIRNWRLRRAMREALLRLRRLGVVPSRYLIVVSIPEQALGLFEWRAPSYHPLGRIRCSTSRFGVGETSGSNKTPRGLHRVAQKIGGGWPSGAVFKSRAMAGYTWGGVEDAAVTTRILWLEGLEPGLNRGGDIDSFSRYIYIHGTPNEPGIGRPASRGCVQVGGDDLIPLYELLPAGSLVWISNR